MQIRFDYMNRYDSLSEFLVKKTQKPAKAVIIAQRQLPLQSGITIEKISTTKNGGIDVCACTCVECWFLLYLGTIISI